MSTARAAAVKPKKPPACDRCKAKRVLCHPSPTGCPRCLEKGEECTTTPTIRKAPRPRARTAVVSPPSLPPPSSTPTPLSSATTQSDPAGPAASSYASEASIGTSAARLEIDNRLAKDLFDNAGLRFTHPLIRACGFSQAFTAADGHVSRLPARFGPLAFAAFACGALLSLHPSIIGDNDQRPASFAEAERRGPDLRHYGKQRRSAFLALRDEAVRLAKAGDVLLEATPLNAGTCSVLDFLHAVDRNSAANRPWLLAYNSHLRSLTAQRMTGDCEASATQWAMFLSVDYLAGIGDGSAVLSRNGLDPLIGQPELDVKATRSSEAAALTGIRDHAIHCLHAMCNLQATLLDSRLQSLELDEAAVIAALEQIDVLSGISKVFVEQCDANLGSSSTFTLFRKAAFSKVQALKSIRFYAAIVWTSLVLPLYGELRRRTCSTAGDPAATLSLNSRFAARRLDSYLEQMREYGFLALEAVIATIERTPHITFWIHLQPHLLVQWAQFLLDQYSSGVTCRTGPELITIAQTLSATLVKLGWSYSTSDLDDIISRLDNLAAAESLNAAFSLPSLADPLTFLTLLPANPGSSSYDQDVGAGAAGPYAPLAMPGLPDPTLSAAPLNASSQYVTDGTAIATQSWTWPGL